VKLLVDVGVGKAVENWLASQGLDMVTVRDLNPGMTDATILALAVREQRLVITMDKDFGEMIFRSRQPHAGVLLLRLTDAPSDEKVL
jgi:predicted nuclease of predicted toxin-antitoxin system